MVESAKPRLLMVDDSRVMRTAAKKMLGGDFDVVLAEDGVEGWQKICDDQSIQVVFSDLSMPNLDGYGLLKKIRESDDSGISGLPVIIVTGAENDEGARETALKSGATDFITKPFNSTDMLARATAHAKYQRERKQLQQQTMFDQLTGLGNARFLESRLRQELAFSRRHGHQLSIIAVDVDHFHDIFLKVGKSTAETLLKQVAKIVSELARKEDTSARVGLARFMLLLPCADSEGAMVFANRLHERVAKINLELKDFAKAVSCSVGVSTPESHPGQTPRSVMDEVEIIMKALEKEGGNKVICDVSLRQSDGQLLPSAPEAPSKPDEAIASVDQAIQVLARGDRQSIISALPFLRRQLAPLLSLMAEESKKAKKLI